MTIDTYSKVYSIAHNVIQEDTQDMKYIEVFE